MQLLFSIFILYVCGRNKKTMDRILTFSMLIFFILIDFYRNGYGVDEPSYYKTYIEFRQNAGSFPFDFSFYAIYYLLDFIGVPSDYFNKTITFIYLLILYGAVSKVTKENFRSLHFLLLSFSYVSLDFMFNAYRQGFSFLFLYIAINEYLNGRLVKGSLWAAISAGFHWSSIIVVLLYFCSKLIREKQSYYLILLLFPFVLISMFTPLGVLKYAEMLINILPVGDGFISHLNAYLDASNVADSSMYSLNIFGRFPLAISVVGSLLFILLCYDRFNDKRIIPLMALLLIYCLLFMEMAYSFRNYYWMLPFLALIMVNYCSVTNGRDRTKRIATILFIHLIISIPTFYTSGINAMIYNIET